MQVNFVKINPCENMTVFVLDKVARHMQPSIANKLMAYGSINAEQVGFIEESEDLYRVQMMGGEFCGNASRAFASYMVYKNYPGIRKIDGAYAATFQVSGLERTLTCLVTPESRPNVFYSKIEMPLPIDLTNHKLIYKDAKISLSRVDFEGISHFIVNNEFIDHKLDFFNYLKASIENEGLEAFGLMYYNKDENFIDPLVYVKATDTTCFERSCASGSAALATSLVYTGSKSLNLEINQPGGSLEVFVDFQGGKIQTISLAGLVEIVAEGSVII